MQTKKIWYFLSWQRIDALASKYCSLRGSYKCVSISAFRDERASLCMLLVVEGNAAKTWHVSLATDFSQEMLYSTPCRSWKWFKRLIAFRCDVIWVAGCFQTWCSVQAVKAFNLDLLLCTFMLIGARTCNEIVRFGIVITTKYLKSSGNVKVIKSWVKFMEALKSLLS